MSRELVDLLEKHTRLPSDQGPAPVKASPAKPKPAAETPPPVKPKPKRPRRKRPETDAELRAVLKRWAWGDPPLLPE